MTEVLAHQISFHTRRDIRVHTSGAAGDVPEPDGKRVYNHADLLARHRTAIGDMRQCRDGSALGALIVGGHALNPDPSIAQLVRRFDVPSGAVILQEVHPDTGQANMGGEAHPISTKK